MKKHIIFVMSAMLIILSLDGRIYMGDWLHKFQEGSKTDYTPIHFYSEKKQYVQGGTLFIFPSDYFTDKPHVYVSIQLNNTDYAPELEFNAFITELSSSAVKVNVNKVKAGIIHNFSTEADSQDVIVHVLAYGY